MTENTVKQKGQSLSFCLVFSQCYKLHLTNNTGCKKHQYVHAHFKYSVPSTPLKRVSRTVKKKKSYVSYTFY